MQYILTEEELDLLTPLKRLQERDEALEWARKIIVKLAKVRCGKKYCDVCPVANIPGQTADRPPRVISNLICTRLRNYSKGKRE